VRTVEPANTVTTSEELRPAIGPDRTGQTLLRRWGTQVALTTITVIVLAGIWELLSNLNPPFWPEIILSKPSEIVPALFSAITSKFVWVNFWVTFQETMYGFVIGAGSGFVLGVLIALSKTFSRAVYPIVVLFQATPRVALAPVFIAWFGFGMSSKVALAAAICFFPVLVNTITGLSLVDENALMLMRSLKASRFQVFMHLRMLSALPTVFAGLKSAMTFALIGAVIAELLGSNEGAGQLIDAASFQLQMENVFAYLTLLGFMGLGLFLVINAIERRIVFWHSDWEHE
jgi:NitT/TauT family transport system permease protein